MSVKVSRLFPGLLLLCYIYLASAQRRPTERRVGSVEELTEAVTNLQNNISIFIDAESLELSAPLVITAAGVSIRGRPELGTILNCPETAPAFNISSPDVRIEELLVEGCRRESGVIVHGGNNTAVHTFLRRITFRDNIIQMPDRSPAAPLLVRQCIQGACSASVTVVLEQCVFEQNIGERGGAILNIDAQLIIRNCSFTGNRATTSGGALHLRGLHSNVTIEQTTFRDNVVIGSGSVFEVTAANGSPLEVVKYWDFIFPTATGGAIDVVTLSQMTVRNCEFISNLAPAGGAIAIVLDVRQLPVELQSSSIGIELIDSIFDRNKADYSTGTRTGDRASSFNLGGALYVASSSTQVLLHLIGCDFTRNVARFGGAIHMVTSLESSSRIDRSTFSENNATESGGALLLRNAGQVDFTNSVCSHNFAFLGGCMMLTNHARLRVVGLHGFEGDTREGRQTVFRNNTAVNGGAIMCAACRSAAIRDPVFEDNIAASNGGAVYILEVNQLFSLSQATFRNNIAVRGGAVASEAAANVNFYQESNTPSQFLNNTALAGAAIHVMANHQRENRFEAFNSNFDGNRAVSVARLLMDPLLRAVFLRTGTNMPNTFTGGESETGRRWQGSACGEGGGGAMCLDLFDVPPGAVVDVVLRNSTIRDNRARVGGGLFVAIDASPSWNEGESIRSSCPATRLYDPCRLFRFISMTVTNNYASAGGGGIFIQKPGSLAVSHQCSRHSEYSSFFDAMVQSQSLSDPNICSDVINNTVSRHGYGENVATSVDSISVDESARIIRNHTGSNILAPSCVDCPDVILVYVLDAFGKIIRDGIDDARLHVTLFSDDIFGEERYEAEHGVIEIDQTIGFRVGQRSSIEIQSTSNSSLNTSLVFFTRQCLPGEEEVMGEEGRLIRCQSCRPLRYVFDQLTSGCEPCEDRAICNGGAALVPVDGYWHSTPFSPQFHPCIRREACRYDQRSNALTSYYDDLTVVQERLRELDQIIENKTVPVFPDYNQCARGYSSILCGSCLPGFGHFDGGECVECSTGRPASILVSVAMSIWTAIFVAINIFTTFSSTQRQIRLAVYRQQTLRPHVSGNPQSFSLRDLHSHDTHVSTNARADIEEYGSFDDRITAMVKLTEMLKILINYLQVTSVALSINANWIGIIKSMLSVESIMISVTTGSHFVPLDCSFGQSGDLPNSIKVLWIRATFPIVLLLFFVTVCGVHTIYRQQFRHIRIRNQRNNARDDTSSVIGPFLSFRSQAIVTVIVVVFFSYISMTSSFMRTVNCLDVDSDPLEDSSRDHRYSRFAIETRKRVWAEDTSLYCFEGRHTLTGVFGIMGLIFFSLAVVLFILTWLPANAKRLGDPQFIAQYGFIYQGYKEKWHLSSWEAIITIRKALIAAAVVYAFPLGPNLQAVCAMGVLILAIGLHFICEPFKTFPGHPNVPYYAGCLLRKMNLNSFADFWVRYNNRSSLNALESGSLLTSLIVFYSGVLFNDDNTSQSGKYTMAAFTFIVNLAFCGFILCRLYYGAHVAVNFYCQHLEAMDPSMQLPSGEGPLTLLRKSILIFRRRSAFHQFPVDTGNASHRFDEHV